MRCSISSLLLLLGSLLVGSLRAQTIVPLVLEGDAVPGVGSVTSISNLAIDEQGNWLVECDTDQPNTDADEVVFRNGVLLLREGDPLAAPAGATLNEFDSAVLNDAGDAVFNFTLSNTAGGASDDSGVYFNTSLVIQEGDVSGAAGFGAGTVYRSFSDVKLTDSNLVLLRGFADDPTVAGTTDFFAVTAFLDAGGALLGELLVAREGDVPPGQVLAINTIRTGPHSGAINALGDVIWCADLDTASPPMDAVCYLNSSLLAQEGAPAPVAGRTWGDIISPEVDLNDSGDWTFKDRLDSSDTSTDDIIVKSGAKFVQAGDALPAIAPWTLESFGNGPADLTDGGDVLWFGNWNDPDTNRDEGLFLNTALIVQEGVTVVDGLTIDDVGDQSDNYYASHDGSFVIFEGTLSDGREGAFLYVVEVGTAYCTAEVNSTGGAASIVAGGSALALSNDFTLTAFGLPSAQFGYFLAGTGNGELFPVPGSQGRLCIGGAPQGRFNFLIRNSGASGSFSIAVDLASIPVSPPVAVAPGDTWNFQAWYRDSNPGTTSNFTDARSVTFL